MIKTITAIAKTSKLNTIHPVEKILLTILPIIVLGFSKGIFLLIINTIIFALLHVKYKTPLKLVMKFTLAILLFAAVSSITFIFDYGIYYCIIILLKCFSSGLSVAFLVMTTPIDHILSTASKYSALRDMCDIAKSMERFLTLIDDERLMLYKAMKSRGGFDSYTLKIKSTAKLAGLLLFNTLRRWSEIKDAINSRCFRGFIPYSKGEFKLSRLRLSLIMAYNILLVAGILIGKC